MHVGVLLLFLRNSGKVEGSSKPPANGSDGQIRPQRRRRKKGEGAAWVH